MVLALAVHLHIHPWQYDLLTADQFLAYCAQAERMTSEGDSGGG